MSSENTRRNVTTVILAIIIIVGALAGGYSYYVNAGKTSATQSMTETKTSLMTSNQPASIRGAGANQTCASGMQVIFVHTSPGSLTVGGAMTVDFGVVVYTVEPYLGCIGNPVTGLHTGSFILSPEGAPLASMLAALQSSQATEHDNVTLSPGSKPGEYLAEIQVTQNDPTGNVLVYVKALSLQATVNGTVYVGPASNVSSAQTEDTSGVSLIQIRPSSRAASPPILLLILLAAIILLMTAIQLLRHRGKLIRIHRP
jgi:hypothetical protein